MLFGHQNNDTNLPAQDALTPPPPPAPAPPAPVPPAPAPSSTSGLNPLAVDPSTGASLPVAPPDALDQPHDEVSSVLDQPASHDSSAPEPAINTLTSHVEPANLDGPDPVRAASAPAFHDPVSAAQDNTPVSDDLLQLKQQALSQLSPLVGKLEQTPEEKFRTTMMLIQTTDNQSLLQEAYTAAQAITDEKARAQALLDVVNEINYFTQHKPSN